ncbi:MAG TPA: sulfotransferase family 2 domain-containing protein [Oscillospiraceae bacterium]|nr:sulfotransferase family 2 domain-containing protein [Oscillospiraceae bacterium]HPK35646.1 sulfotransferase family 2 domain-containing protein [Oscillospiraceae bacterium]HPR74709.1 sulfotransferase family 2 domain-containing protein [Oscillospiraceae bacterium]
MGIYREKVVPFFSQWDFMITIYLFAKGLFNLIKHGLFYPIGHIDMPEKEITYISVPKAACSSIKASMANRKFNDDYSVHSVLRDKYETANTHRKYFIFSFVRNPFDRLVSCYESKYHHDPKTTKSGKPQHLVYDYYLLGFLSKDKGFDHFVKRVCMIPKRFAEEHFRSQYLTLYRNGKCIADFVGKFENLETDYEPIRQKYGFSPLAHYNKTDKGNWMDYYTLKTAEMIYRKYRRDIETFGYQDEYEKLLKYLAAKEEKSV